MTTVVQQEPNNKGVIPWKIVIGLAVGAVVLLLVVGFLVANLGNIFNFIFDYGGRVDESQVIICRLDPACSTIQAFVFGLIVFFIIVTGFAYTTLLERVLLARLQHRVGPNRVGPFGLLQPAADGVKLIFKEDIVPAGAYKLVYLLSPILKAVPTLIVLAVIPFGPDILVPWFNGLWYRVPLSLADPNVGVLWLLAITSLGTYGVVLAGWSSNNKYAMLGGMRASAQMLSYELSLGLTMAVPIIIVGSMSLGDIVSQQRFIWEWFIFQNPLAAGILFIALLAEVNRAPFDLPEAEQELTAGFMTEYSGMKFASFMMGEYLGMIAISMIFSSLYLGGYQDGFGLVDSLPILGPLVLLGKVVLLLMFMIWIRATLPRIRYDRLMSFGWKIMVPLALVAVAWTSVAVLIADSFQGSPVVYGIAAGIVFVLVLAGGVAALRSAGAPSGEDAEEEDLANDPMVTGERRGLGWLVLTAVGAIIAIPFALFELLVKTLEAIARQFGGEEELNKKDTPASGD